MLIGALANGALIHALINTRSPTAAVATDASTFPNPVSIKESK
ncbi:hypothetical protein [Thermomonas carbonis]|nr:hypothetical protein [Thermomonas carbonis]